MMLADHLHCVRNAIVFGFCVAADHCDFSMETTNIISIVVSFGSHVLCLGSSVQGLGLVGTVWRRDTVGAGHH